MITLDVPAVGSVRRTAYVYAFRSGPFVYDSFSSEQVALVLSEPDDITGGRIVSVFVSGHVCWAFVDTLGCL